MSQKILYPVQNVYVSEYYSTTNFVDKPYLFSGQFTGDGDDYRSLIKFDLSQLVAPITISDATLSLYVYDDDITTSPTDVKIYRLIEDFNQYLTTWNDQPSSFATEIDSSTVATGFTGFVTFDVTALVQDWVSGVIPNSGILVKGLETINSLVKYRSHKYDNNAEWPKLEINYIAGAIKTQPYETGLSVSATAINSNAIELAANQSVSFEIENVGATNTMIATIIVKDAAIGATWNDTLQTTTVPPSSFVNLTTLSASDQAAVKLVSSATTIANILPTVKEL